MAHGSTAAIIQRGADIPACLAVVHLCNEAHYDQDIIDYLDKGGLKYFDMNVLHRENFKKSNLSIEDYMKRYYIGHYSPSGNHFFAHSIKDTFVEWLNLKPIT